MKNNTILLALTLLSSFMACTSAPSENQENSNEKTVEEIIVDDKIKSDSVKQYWEEKMKKLEEDENL